MGVVRESWEGEFASELREVDALLAGIADGEVEPFEGAFGAYRLLQNGHAPVTYEQITGASDEMRETMEESNRARLVLGRMVDWWATRLPLRERVERDIVSFAGAWWGQQQDGARVDWPAWRRWLDPRASPFGDPQPTLANGGRANVAGGKHSDLQGVPRPGEVQELSLIDCTITSLDGIERFEQLRTLFLHDVQGLTDLSAIERLTALTSLTIATEQVPDPALVSTLDFARLPNLTDLSIQCFADEPFEPIPVDTNWMPHAPYLMHLCLEGFVPASGTFDDIVAARWLVNLSLTARDPRELEPVLAALPLTHVTMHHLPTAAPQPGGFGMATAEGDHAVATMVETICAWLQNAAKPTSDGLNHRLSDGMAAIAAAGHSEVFDTAVRDDIFRSLRNVVDEAGIDDNEIDFD